MEAHLYKRILSSFFLLISSLLIAAAETDDISKPSNEGILTSLLFVITSYCSFFMKFYKCLVCILIAGELLVIYCFISSLAIGNVNAVILAASAGLLGLTSYFIVRWYKDDFNIQGIN